MGSSHKSEDPQVRRPTSPTTHESDGHKSDDPQVRWPQVRRPTSPMATSPMTHKSDDRKSYDHKSDVRKSDGTWNYDQNDTEYGT